MPLNVKKRSRKPSRDPQIERLLQLKDKWNTQASQFIYDMIGLKRGLNGRGDQEHRLPPSRITNKLDQAVPSLLNQMAGQYRQLATTALDIIRQQEELSKRPKAKPIHAPGSPTPGNDNSSQEHKTSAARFDLTVEASSALSRIWYSMKSPFRTAPGHKTRSTILSTLVELKHAVEEMQDASVSTGQDGPQRLQDSFNLFEEKIKYISQLFQRYAGETGNQKMVNSPSFLQESGENDSLMRFYDREFGLAYRLIPSIKRQFGALEKLYGKSNNDIDRADIVNKAKFLYDDLLVILDENFKTEQDWSTVSELYDLPKTKVEKELPVKEKKPQKESRPEKDPELDRRFQHYKEEFTLAYLKGFQAANSGFTKLTSLYNQASSNEDRSRILNYIEDFYKEMVIELRKHYDTKGVGWGTVTELFYLHPTIKQASITIQAHNIFTRMLKRKRMNLPLIGDASSLRTTLFDQLKIFRTEVINFMDAIESNSGIDVMANHISSIKKQFMEIKSLKDLVISKELVKK